MSPCEKSAQGVDPSTHSIIEFNDVNSLHEKILTWTQYMNEHDLFRTISNGTFRFCINMQTQSYDGIDHQALLYPIEHDGTISVVMFGGTRRPPLARTISDHILPEDGTIVITQDLFNAYLQAYSTLV